jgi:radical SAM protein with 4Fe4S-binding SPASM domain
MLHYESKYRRSPPVPCSGPMLLSHAPVPCSGPMLLSHAPVPCSGPMLRSHAPVPCSGPMLRSHAPVRRRRSIYIPKPRQVFGKVAKNCLSVIVCYSKITPRKMSYLIIVPTALISFGLKNWILRCFVVDGKEILWFHDFVSRRFASSLFISVFQIWEHNTSARRIREVSEVVHPGSCTFCTSRSLCNGNCDRTWYFWVSAFLRMNLKS